MISLFYHYGQQALQSLLVSKLRALLAILGVLVGTAAIVALISCSQLATEKALSQFKALGTKLVSITVFQQTGNGTRTSDNEISLTFWRQLPQLIPSVAQIAPYSTAYQGLSYQGQILQGVIVGADEALANVVHIELAEGHFVSFVESFEHDCVIGHALAQQLKRVSIDNPLGRQIQIGSALYTIIGVAKPWQESGFFNEDINQAVIIPITGMAVVNRDAKVNNAILLLNSDKDIEQAIQQIKTILTKQAPNLSFFIRSAKQIITSMENQNRIFTLLLAVIGSISLLVGGIGVMNVMLISVNERKKEIGIRKALGARNKQIQLLFLAESIILTLIGGVSGVILGVFITWIIAYFNQWPFIFYYMPPLAGFIVSVVSGIFFGFYPAVRAARMSPISSLRSE